MAYLDNVPTFNAGTWFTENAAAIELVNDQLLDIQKQAMPTLKIMMNHSKEVELGPDGEINWNILYDMYDVWVMSSPNQRWTAEDLDPVTRMTWPVKDWVVAASTNQQEMVRYGRQGRSRIDLIKQKVEAMHRGMTWKMAWSLFSNWSETISANTIDVEAALSSSPLPPSLSLRGVTTTDSSDREYSIPMIIREAETGHTIGNVPTEDNQFWQISATNGATPTRNVTATDPRCDVVTAQGAPLVELSPSEIRTHLSKVQRGAWYDLYAACPADLYGVLEDYLLAERERPQSQELHDLGIDAHFVYGRYNCKFYVDPMMTDLWPNTIFFYDPSIMFYVFDSAFAPWIVPWERIPGGPQYATAEVFEGNLVCIDRRGLSVMHGYNAG